MPPFEATNHLSLAVKINAGKFARIPAQYSDNLYRAVRWMIQVDPSKRPTVEDLERIPDLKPHAREASHNIREHQLGQKFATRMRDVASREDAVRRREETLRAREAALAAKERAVEERERAVSMRERGMSAGGAFGARAHVAEDSGSSSSSSSSAAAAPMLGRAASAPDVHGPPRPHAAPSGAENVHAGIARKAGGIRRTHSARGYAFDAGVHGAPGV